MTKERYRQHAGGAWGRVSVRVEWGRSFPEEMAVEHTFKNWKDFSKWTFRLEQARRREGTLVLALGISYRVLWSRVWEKCQCTHMRTFCKDLLLIFLVHLTLLILFLFVCASPPSLYSFPCLGFLSWLFSFICCKIGLPSLPYPLDHLFLLFPDTSKPSSIFYSLALVFTCGINGSFFISS